MTAHRITAVSAAGPLTGSVRRAVLASVALASAAVMPPGAAHGQSEETLRAENQYRECLYSKTRSGRYRQQEDRESDFALLGECRKEWVVYMDLCVKQGFDNRTCVLKSRLVIHAILDLNGK